MYVFLFIYLREYIHTIQLFNLYLHLVIFVLLPQQKLYERQYVGKHALKGTVAWDFQTLAFSWRDSPYHPIKYFRFLPQFRRDICQVLIHFLHTIPRKMLIFQLPHPESAHFLRYGSQKVSTFLGIYIGYTESENFPGYGTWKVTGQRPCNKTVTKKETFHWFFKGTVAW